MMLVKNQLFKANSESSEATYAFYISKIKFIFIYFLLFFLSYSTPEWFSEVYEKLFFSS